jgi:hypothetical protein
VSSIKALSASGISLNKLVIAIVSLVVVIALSIPFYQSINAKALQAEAQLMLSYIATLEAAYFVDTGKYAYFAEPYGSQVLGKENCTRPSGAEELGFVLKNCGKNPRDGGLRYYYQVEPSADGKDYTATAISGSDVTKESFICQGSTLEDIWLISSAKQLINRSFCD